MKSLLPCFLACAIATATQARPDDTDPFVCAVFPDPVINLNHGSRYIDDDDSRSTFDDDLNDDVNAQLNPIDNFISTLANTANHAVSDDEDRLVAAQCVMSGLAEWADANALSDLATMNAQLAVPSRIAGLAFAYAQVREFLPTSDDSDLVEDWLSKRTIAMMEYFDTDAPPMASKNNLRAWAALAAARVGLVVDDQEMIDWADASVRLVACQAASNGTLPLEMKRNHLALHYQLHGVGPLVVTAALLEPLDHQLFLACDMAIHRAVYFIVDAFDDPTTTEKLTGYPQTYFDGSEELRGFELAWATSYLSLFYAPRLQSLTEEFGPLGNSKLGGRQTLLWNVEEAPPTD